MNENESITNDTQRRRQSDTETDNEKGAGNKDCETEAEALKKWDEGKGQLRFPRLENHRWLEFE